MKKKGWIRIVEAVIAVLLIASVLLMVIGQGKISGDEDSSKIYRTEISILREIQLDSALRKDILDVDIEALPVEWDDFDSKGLSEVKQKIETKTPDYLDCKAMACEMTDNCILEETSGKEVYVQSIAITANIEKFSPRQLKLFCWKGQDSTSGIEGCTPSCDSGETCVSGSCVFEPIGNDEYTVLLLHCDGADQSTTFTDSSASAHTVTANGDAQVDTAVYKFATGSAMFDGTGDYLSIPDSDDWAFGSGDFTIDGWINFASLPTGSTYYMIASQIGDGSNWWYLTFTADSSNGLGFQTDTAGNQNSMYQGSMDGWSAETWYHIAVVSYNGEWNLYRDGVSIASITPSYTLGNYNAPLGLGAYASYSVGSNPFNGHIDEFRISKGVARTQDPDDFMYVGIGDSFAVPTREYS